jgi:hypothetical protein
MVLRRLRRQYRPSGNSEEVRRTLLWPFRILVRPHITDVDAPHLICVQNKVLDNSAIPYFTALSGIHIGVDVRFL